jgi:hypothetical protein
MRFLVLVGGAGRSCVSYDSRGWGA